MERIAPHIWRYEDEARATSYLAVGTAAAVMVDCGMGLRLMMPEIRKITALPVSLLLTHAHPDHYGAAGEFSAIWLHERDVEAVAVMEPAFASMGVARLPMERVHAFRNGRAFDLGGVRLLAVDLAGHTPGSVVFVDEADRAVFSGDAVGSGEIVLMTVPMALSLAEYRASLTGFLKRAKPWEEYAWLPGHVSQAGKPGTAGYNPPCMRLVRDMAVLCDRLLSGEEVGVEVDEPNAPGGRALRARYATAGIVYGRKS